MIALLVGLAGCTLDDHPAPVLGTTYRIGKDVRDKESELWLDILTTEAQCRKIANTPEELAVCRPFVDRANAEVQIAFQFLDRMNEQQFPVALTNEPDQLIVSHDNTKQNDWELIPHNPRESGQLYIVLIDGSSSMYDNDGERIRKVKRALKLKEVKDAFFPSEDAKTGVMLLRFTDRLVSIDGGAPRILKRRGAYERMVEEHLDRPSGGFTHLYKAVRDAMTEIVKLPNVRKFLAADGAQPTVIALTDGFNNEAGSDTCGTNVTRLKKTLDVVREARASRGSGRPRLFTIGLGSKYRQKEKPEGINTPVTRANLCGRYADSLIDRGLENQGIDHVSLAWLAEAGGGVSFVRQQPKGVADVFLAASRKRYDWFELKYKTTDSIYHRKTFETEIRVQQGFVSSTKVKFYPSPWLDAPTSEPIEGSIWTRPSSLFKTLTLLMPILGLLVFLNYIPAALFNARRAVFRRARPRK